ncbi:MAG TPA: iron-sulfur cluster assembly scaffold protein [Candidatus Saccharimonadales bacterium]|nr:iron-sulfur cluster assembly scaffold protein [Candidatus Saccharimonadales bacterium]
MYSKKVLQYFMKPKNQGSMKNPDGFGTVGNPRCGDIMTVYIKVKKLKNKEFISDIKFETLGCAAAIATSSMVTEMAKGKNLDDAFKITRQDVADELEGLPPLKMHCSNLAEGALKRAIEDYRSKAGSKAKTPEKTKKASASKKKKK